MTTASDAPGKGTFRYRVRAVGLGGPSAWTTSVGTVTVTNNKGK